MTNYTYRLIQVGLCSELNRLLGFYNSKAQQNCNIYIDASRSQYFKSFSIYSVFDFPDPIVKTAFKDSLVIPATQWRRAALRGYKLSNPIKLTYTKDFQAKINQQIEQLNLPQNYNCFHVRRGDKVGEKLCRFAERIGKTESRRHEVEDFFEKCNQSIDSIFIMTDDYACIEEARQYIFQNNLLYKLYYLVMPNQAGHSTDVDIDNNKSYRLEELVLFFSEIEIAKNSQQFIGTKSSNIFRYIKNQCVKDVEFISLD
jgi:hypothetical protein